MLEIIAYIILAACFPVSMYMVISAGRTFMCGDDMAMMASIISAVLVLVAAAFDHDEDSGCR